MICHKTKQNKTSLIIHSDLNMLNRIRELVYLLTLIILMKNEFISFWSQLHYSMRMDGKVYRLKNYLLLMTFFINEIQALQHWWKKWVYSRESLIWLYSMRASWFPYWLFSWLLYLVKSLFYSIGDLIYQSTQVILKRCKFI